MKLPSVFNRKDKHSSKTKGVLSFKDDAKSAVVEQEKRGGSLIIYVTLVCVLGFIGWASIWNIEEVTRAEAKVIPSKSVQIVQSLDGGVIAEILVNEGDQVSKDAPLLRIETVRADSQLSESRTRFDVLSLKAARLRAELIGDGDLQISAELKASQAQTYRQELAVLRARRSELNATLKTLDVLVSQRGQEIREAQGRRDAAGIMFASQDKELQSMKPLIKIGAASEIEVLRLEREALRSRSDQELASVSIEKARSAVEETKLKRGELQAAFLTKVHQELSETSAELARLKDTLPGMQDRVEKTIIKAPTAGIVKTLSTKTVGAVLLAGKDVAEIVPLDDTVLMEAQVPPRDIGNLKVGQNASLRFSAYDFSVHGSLTGKLELISPDTIKDEKGNAFYLVRVRAPKPRNINEGLGGKNQPILPGMTATVDMLTGSKTVLTYLLKPIYKAQQKAFTER